MKIQVELSESDLKRLIMEEIHRRLGDAFDEAKVVIEVKSKQNYKSEWEAAHFRATYLSEET